MKWHSLGFYVQPTEISPINSPEIVGGGRYNSYNLCTNNSFMHKQQHYAQTTALCTNNSFMHKQQLYAQTTAFYDTDSSKNYLA
ncbi:MAG: hypothetical protein QY308_04615 [Ignavibacteriaceae bacterium]|nr:MAG: hypothetical protein QY308_04615 [Ignavibacteriaceae bacterium]